MAGIKFLHVINILNVLSNTKKTPTTHGGGSYCERLHKVSRLFLYIYFGFANGRV